MKAHVLELRPTQFALGMAEVEVKTAKLKKMKFDELSDYLENHRVPVVRSPEGDSYLIDHHHLVRACWEAGVEHVKVELKSDLSHLGQKEFWKEMVQKRLDLPPRSIWPRPALA